MTKPTEMGLNGIGVAGRGAELPKPTEGGMAGAVAQNAAAVDGARVVAVRAATSGDATAVFLDLLGERLAFERTGARLYEALLCKLDVANGHPGGPTREELSRIHDQEVEHFHLLCDAIERLGGDSTVVTPSADVMGVAASGLLQVLGDARTTLNEGLKAILIAELADSDGWQVLTEMAERLGEAELAVSFQRAYDDEEEHLASVRTWLARALEGEAGLAAEEPMLEAEASAAAP